MNLKDELESLTKVDGIASALVVSRDGFVIEGSNADHGLEMDAVGAIISAGIGFSQTMGDELKVGEVSQVMLEFKTGTIVVNFLDDSAILATVAAPNANLGNLRYQVKKHAPAIAGAL